MAERRAGGGDQARGRPAAGDRPSGQTRLADLLAARPGLYQVLRALDPDALAADQPTLADFARRLGLPLAAVLAAIDGALPEACARAAARGAGASDTPEPEPEWFAAFAPAAAAAIDVRPLIAAGRDPFAAVMAAVADVPAGGGLIIDAPFDPQPLRRVLADRGFATWARSEAAGHVRVWCWRCGDTPAPGAAAAEGAQPRLWVDAGVVHIDVRGLPPPRPLTAILKLIDHGTHRGTIVVHHQREPVYLWPELADRGWQAEALPAPTGEVRLLLRRADAGG